MAPLAPPLATPMLGHVETGKHTSNWESLQRSFLNHMPTLAVLELENSS